MRKLAKMLKSLPPEVRMLMALMGLGSMVGVVYFLRRLFPGVSLLMLILCVVAVLIVVGLIVFVISKLFGRGRRKRANRMAADLAGEGEAGPQSMDRGADIKANKEKFFNAIRDMRKNIGISVYDLPWYIVMGDSGCGKTKLVNEGGLTFSTGKPEGYQLGTLNYNWWFTEDAIFIDMAGRLCNPQDDGDRREWLGFLDTIAAGRRGFPVNGALVCVSAEHLLQDPPEKLEADANTALERLRDLQTKLGVTFATYLVVTKCDKILGFLQFFEGAQVKFEVKKQVFGWSKPGDFSELYDPERFHKDFDSLYARLHDLRLRRLNDDSEEIDLGLAYSFPEEFRRFFEPLQIYVRTLFPYIRHPRAVKNLVFRGVYFTSATQEGELILKYLTERLGAEAADQFPPLDLYPRKSPFFIKDLLFKKVFPERGLVFRNEQQVVRNRKLHKFLKVAAAALAVVLVAAFWWSSVAFSRVIGEPRLHAQQAAESVDVIAPDSALQLAGTMSTDVGKLKQTRFAAMVLSWGVGTNKPVEYLERIRVGLVEETLIEALEDVDHALRSGTVLRQSLAEEADSYMDALEQYVTWHGCRRERGLPSQVTAEGFGKLCSVVRDPQAISNQPGFVEQVGWYHHAVDRSESLSRNPTELLERAGLDPAETIHAAIGHVYEHLFHYATLDENHPDDGIREWMRIHAACERVEDSYAQMLAAADDEETIDTLDGLQEFRGRFISLYDTFAAALGGCEWRSEHAGTMLADIRSLKRELLLQRQRWLDYGSRLGEAAQACSLADASIIDAIASIAAGGGNPPREGLDRAFWRSLRENGIVQTAYRDDVYSEELFPRLITEIYELYPEIIAFTEGDGVSIGDTLSLALGAEGVLGRMRVIRDALDKADFTVPDDLSGETVAGWIERLDDHLSAIAVDDGSAVPDELLSAYWLPEDLSRLYETHRDLIHLGQGTRLLRTIQARLEGVGQWGVSELFPYDERTAEIKAPYSIKLPPRAPSTSQPRLEQAAPLERPVKSKRRDRDVFSGSGSRGPRDVPTSTESRSTRKRGWRGVPACVTHEFLNERAAEWVMLMVLLNEMQRVYLEERGYDVPLNERCLEQLRTAAMAYTDAYVGAWSEAYGSKKLVELEKLTRGTSHWDALARQFARGSGRGGGSRDSIADELVSSLEWILRSIPWATYHPEHGAWEGLDWEEWRRVAEWVHESVDRRWNANELGTFAFKPKLPPGDSETPAEPWANIAGRFDGAWRDLAQGIGRNTDLPARFDEVEVPGRRPPIPWGALDGLRDVCGLRDEKLTGQLVSFEEVAQELLSVELTQILYGIQKAYFKEVKPYDGWPFLPGERYGATGLNTVGFDSFKNFLVEVHRAREVFGDLEQSLPEGDRVRRVRKAFLAACEEWFEFLNLEDRMNPEAEELQIAIKGEDPTMEPLGQDEVNDSAQHAYAYFELDLGLSLEETQAAAEGTLRVATLTEKKVRKRDARWKWHAGQAKELSVRLTGSHKAGRRETIEKKLGESSPLALCAYLHRYGRTYDNGKTWYVSHAFDISEKGAGEARPTRGPGDVMGEKLVFTLYRRMPGPILRLAPASTGESSER